MHVELTYFKPSGKYYASGEYTSKKEQLFDIHREVAEKNKAGDLPGLMEGSSDWIVSVRVPHHNHPHLVLPHDNR